jgi:hypothetical protein
MSSAPAAGGTGSPAATRRRATVRQDEVLAVGDLRATGNGQRATVERGGDAPCRPKAAWVTAHALTTAESPLESLARTVTMIGGFPEPRTQVGIETRLGPFRVDLLDRGGTDVHDRLVDQGPVVTEDPDRQHTDQGAVR